jgi:hypothetical protein
MVLQSIDSYIPSYDTKYKIISTRMCRLILDCTHVIIILAEESNGSMKGFMEDLMIDPMVIKEAARVLSLAGWLIMKVLFISYSRI